MTTINRKLNLVVPIMRDDETVLYVHSTPLMPETFEKYHLVLAKAWSMFAQNGLDPRSGPSVAAFILRDVAQQTARAPGLDWWEGPDGVGGEGGLMAEMRRLTNVIAPSKERGWGSVPLETALDQKLLSDEEKSEVLNLLTFFTVASLVPPRVDREKLVKGMAAIYELQTTYSNVMDFITSLKTSTTDDSTGENVPAS